MAGERTFHCSVITPERQVLDCEATFAAIPAHDGEIGIMTGRAPLLCQLGIGVMRVTAGGKSQQIFLDGGFAQMLNNNLAVLSEFAIPGDKVDVSSAEADLKSAVSQPAGPTQESLQARNDAITRARAKLKAAGR